MNNNNIVETLLFIRNGGQVRRWHTMSTIGSESVGRHSHSVALICHFLMDQLESKHLLLAALAHDLPEQMTGDIPGNVKPLFNDNCDNRLDELERDILQVRSLLFQLNTVEENTLLLADRIDGMLFCLEEAVKGNDALAKCFRAYYNAATVISRGQKQLDIVNAIARKYDEARRR